MSQAVTPTHRVPQGGLPAWLQADSSTAPAANLEQGLELQVLSRWGDWAYIRCTNGWSAWVDGRRLHPMYQQAASVQHTATYQAIPAAGTYAAAQAVPQRAPMPAAATVGRTVNLGGKDVAITPALGGAALVLVGALLPWFSITGFPSSNAFEVPLKFLFDPKAEATGLDLGWLVLLGALVAGALALFRPTGRELKSAGSALISISVLYVVQLQRYLSLFPADQRPGLFSSIGFGVYITVIGAVLMIVKLPTGGRR